MNSPLAKGRIVQSIMGTIEKEILFSEVCPVSSVLGISNIIHKPWSYMINLHNIVTATTLGPAFS